MTNISCKRILLTGLAGGLVGGMVKMGWESIVPPRTPQRDEAPPPVTMMKKFKVPNSIQNYTVTYNENEIPLAVMGIHYGFSVANAFAYAMLAERCNKITLGKGLVFGVAIHVIFHEWVLPKLKLTPKANELPIQEHVSELLGHIIWMNSIELFRNAVK